MIDRRTTRNLAIGITIVSCLGLSAGGDGNAGPGGGETAGNNLSYPVIWAEGVAKALRGTAGEFTLEGEWWYWWGVDGAGNPLACRPDPDAPGGQDFCDDGEEGTWGPPPGDGFLIAYAQQDELNEWQASSADWSADTVYPHWIDWGDNLESVPWSLTSMVRTEVVLLENLFAPCEADFMPLEAPDGIVGVDELLEVLASWGACAECPADIVPPEGDGEVRVDDLLAVLGAWGPCAGSIEMTEYVMRHLEGWGQTEMWGLSVGEDGVPQEVEHDFVETFPQATIYSPCARLTIQRLLVTRDDGRLDDLVWEPTVGWTEPEGYPDDLVNPEIFNKAVWQAGEGPGFYNAEVNVKGRIIFGYTWNVRKLNEGAGDYRITFSLDETCAAVPLNTSLAIAQIVEPEEETPLPDGGVAVIDVGNNLTYIDIRITE